MEKPQAVSLPPELWLRICDYLKRQDHLSLSTLNQWFRAFALPLIFKDQQVHQHRRSILRLHNLYHQNLLQFVRSLRITRYQVSLFEWGQHQLPGIIYDRLVGFYLLRMPNLENVDFCYGKERPSPALFRYIARKSSIRQLKLRELALVPLNFWDELRRLRRSDALPISGFCMAPPRGTGPFLVTSVDLRTGPSAQFFTAYPSPSLTCLSVNVEVVGNVGDWSLLKALLKASPHLVDITLHLPSSISCPDRLFEPTLVPHLQRITCENTDLMVQIKEGRPIRSIALYSLLQLEIRGRAVQFDERVESLSLGLDETYLDRAANTIAQSSGVRSLDLLIILCPDSEHLGLNISTLPRTLQSLTIRFQSAVLSDHRSGLTAEVVRHKLFGSFLPRLPGLCPTLWVVDLSCDIRISVLGFLRLAFECTRARSGVSVEWVVKESAARLPDRHFWVIDGVVTREYCDPPG